MTEQQRAAYRSFKTWSQNEASKLMKSKVRGWVDWENGAPDKQPSAKVISDWEKRVKNLLDKISEASKLVGFDMMKTIKNQATGYGYYNKGFGNVWGIIKLYPKFLRAIGKAEEIREEQKEEEIQSKIQELRNARSLKLWNELPQEAKDRAKTSREFSEFRLFACLRNPDLKIIWDAEAKDFRRVELPYAEAEKIWNELRAEAIKAITK